MADLVQGPTIEQLSDCIAAAETLQNSPELLRHSGSIDEEHSPRVLLTAKRHSGPYS